MSNPDPQLTIKGYITDPKFVGYQILTNYENTYWLRLVGRDAWTLYLVLRSFCHDGNSTCHPSIKLLMNILGLTDRRQLIGRVDTTPGKKRILPGFIDVLQEHGLVTAQIHGEGPKQRYIFHVEMTPPLLTSKQVQQLPKPLQKRHEQLLARVSEEVAKLEKLKASSKVRVKKTIKSEAETAPSLETEEGGGTVPPPLVQYHPPGGTVPPKQQPINNTQRTHNGNGVHNNNSSGSEAVSDVVVALIDEGIAKQAAVRLAERHSKERVMEKIDFLNFLRQHKPEQVKNPSGWLRKAIEDDYGPPDGYKTPQEQQQEAQSRAKEKEEREQLEAQRELELQEEKEEREVRRAAQMTLLSQQYGTTEKEISLWNEVLGDIQANLQSTVYDTYLEGSILLSVRDGVARISLRDPKTIDWVQRQLSRVIKRTLSTHSENSIEQIEFEHVPGTDDCMTL